MPKFKNIKALKKHLDEEYNKLSKKEKKIYDLDCQSLAIQYMLSKKPTKEEKKHLLVFKKQINAELKLLEKEL